MIKSLPKIFGLLLILAGVFYYCLQNNVRLFFVVTGSMEPVIPTKSIIISKKLAVNQIKPGLAIVFTDQENSRVTAHRVVEQIDGKYITRGDANDYQDRYLVKSADLLGQVVGVIPVMTLPVILLQLLLVALLYFLGVTHRRFLLFLKHGFSCPTTASNALHRLCIFGRTKKTLCGGQTGFSPGKL